MSLQPLRFAADLVPAALPGGTRPPAEESPGRPSRAGVPSARMAPAEAAGGMLGTAHDSAACQHRFAAAPDR